MRDHDHDHQGNVLGTGPDEDHGHGHGHGQGHGHPMCGGLDHHTGDYTPQQRADLDLVLGLNDRLATAVDQGRDLTDVLDLLDPDPLRYMWVDEGKGRVADTVTAADRVLAHAPALDGHHRVTAAPVPGSTQASRPALARGGRDGSVHVTAWIEWVPGEGEVVRALLGDAAVQPEVQEGEGQEPDTLTPGVADVVRPRAAVTADGTPWVVWGSRPIGPTEPGGGALVLASAHVDGAWTAPEVVSLGDAPAFNAELAAHDDGSLELVWQGRVEGRFGVHARRRTAAGWGPATLVTEGVEANVWDPTVAALPGGAAAYAWSEYRDATYRVVVRRRDAHGALADPVEVTAGRDYALHPSLAATTDGQLWCAFDVITVVGHGGSGPTRLQPASALTGGPDGPDGGGGSGAGEAGEAVPPELLPEVSASLRVVAVEEDGVRTPPGELAPRLDVVPSAMPQLVATDDGGLVVAYRVHRRLPLMTYYWEVAVQALGADGWEPPTTLRGSDGTLEEAAVAAEAGGVRVAVQTDARLARALQWTEGFGGRECPTLLEHHGSVVWHGIHGLGTVAVAHVPSAGPVPTATALAETSPLARTVLADDRREARRWAAARGTDEPERYVAEVGDRRWTLYWGDLHRHSLVSRCTAGDEPSLEDFYRYAWDVCEYDFWAVTDHAENSSDHQWWSLQKIADLFHVPGRFVPLYGFEWTSADTGHQNVIYGDVERGAPIFSAFAEGTTTPRGLWDALAEHPAYPAVTIPHHPGAAMVHHDWGFHDERYGRLVEVFQACRGSYENDRAFRQYADGTRKGTFVVDGLKAGHKVGMIASSDHGHGASYVGAFAETLDRGDVFDALQSRRTFAATTRGVVVDLRAGEHGEVFMGQEAPAGTRRRLTVHAEGYADLARVDLLRDGEVVHELVPDLHAALDLPAGWRRVPLRVEWGEAESTTRWDGSLQVLGGRVLPTDFWSPEVIAADDRSLAWEATTHSFGEPYGAQRGGVEVTLLGPEDAEVQVCFGDAEAGTVRLGDLADTLAAGRDHALLAPLGHARLQHAYGGLTSLGSTSVDLVWDDDAPDDGAEHFYYARVVQVDGEAAWSSPIWV